MSQHAILILCLIGLTGRCQQPSLPPVTMAAETWALDRYSAVIYAQCQTPTAPSSVCTIYFQGPPSLTVFCTQRGCTHRIP